MGRTTAKSRLAIQRTCCAALPQRKVVFTNAPQHYAYRVLYLLGIDDLFEEVFSVESSRFHPKPKVPRFLILPVHS